MSRNIRIVPDHADVQALNNPHETFDILILPGGGPGSKTFCESNDVLQLIHGFQQKSKYVAAICAATTALVASAEKFEIAKARVTSHPSVANDVKAKGWEYSEERIVVDGRVITSRG